MLEAAYIVRSWLKREGDVPDGESVCFLKLPAAIDYALGVVRVSHEDHQHVLLRVIDLKEQKIVLICGLADMEGVFCGSCGCSFDDPCELNGCAMVVPGKSTGKLPVCGSCIQQQDAERLL